MGYHKRAIKRGTLGFASKIREELEELEDAIEQNNQILALCECADLIGAIEAFAIEHGSTLRACIDMMEATKRAFLDGSRGTTVTTARGPQASTAEHVQHRPRGTCCNAPAFDLIGCVNCGAPRL